MLVAVGFERAAQGRHKDMVFVRRARSYILRGKGQLERASPIVRVPVFMRNVLSEGTAVDTTALCWRFIKETVTLGVLP